MKFYNEAKMKPLLAMLSLVFFLFNCQSSEVKQVDMDDILEEELRAEPEPFKEKFQKNEPKVNSTKR
jgi:hypothetical protein